MAAVALNVRAPAVPDRAVLWSLLGHGLLLLLVMTGGIVIPRTPPPPQLAIKATVVDPKSLRQPVPQPAALKPVAIPEPRSEPKPEPKPEPRVEERKAVEARKAEQRADAQRREKAVQDKERAELQKAQQAAEKQKKEKAAAERAKADNEKREVARKQAEAERLKAAQAAQAAEARELAEQLKEEERLLAAADSGELADYVALIRQKVERNWVRPAGARAGLECEILVTQIPGGQVTDVQMGRCNADDTVQRSIEAAVLRASPLPLPNDASLFERNLRFTFKPEQ